MPLFGPKRARFWLVPLVAAMLVAAGLTAAVRGGAMAEFGLAGLVGKNQIVLRRSSDGGWLPVCFCSIPVPFEDMPAALRHALVAEEDRRFHEHRGIDPIGILRALGTNWREKATAEGGSTLTQQLVKFVFLSGERTLERKFLEAAIAVQLEGVMSKQDILAAYLNRATFHYVGTQPIVGVEQAARYYFGKHTADLSVLESAILVGMLRAPAKFNPKDHPRDALSRAAEVLDSMIVAGFLTAKEKRAAVGSALKRGPEQLVTFEPRYFGYWAMREVLAANPTLEFREGLRFFVSLDILAQHWAEREVKRATAAIGHSVDGAIVGMTLDGRVTALVGGRSFRAIQWDHATLAKRQPASTFKPFVYLAALERGVRADAVYSGAPIDGMHIRNANGTYPAAIGLTEALARSVNTVAVRLQAEIGAAAIIDAAHRAGITSYLRGDDGLALGASEVTLLELTAAFGVFATHGRQVRPIPVLAVVDSATGRTLLRWKREPSQVVAPHNADAVSRMLREVVTAGTGQAGNVSTAAAGKTGTSDDNRDAWFVGFDERYLVGMWLGRDDAASVNNLTGSLAAKFWGHLVANLSAIRNR
jgi:penicillin-binding protein 1A